jgi:Exostosin family
VRKICLVGLFDQSCDFLISLERALSEFGFEVETHKIPYVWAFGRDYVNKLKILLKKKSQEQFLIFSPETTELFLKEADFTIIYSAYRSWFDQKKMRVIPHVWTPVRPPKSIDHLTWTGKPLLRIGFMGRSYTNSRLSNIAAKFPVQLKQWLLRGSYLRNAAMIGLMNDQGFSIKAINAFSRTETMNVLRAKKENYRNVALDIIEKRAFNGSEQDKNEYINHLERNTYIICPRGTENYSFRAYEVLSRGRIPVIIDTDVVLPKEIAWDCLSVKVPYDSLDGIYDIISRDYESRSGSDFIVRQKKAFTSMTELRNMRWIKDLANEVRDQICCQNQNH